MMVCRKMFASLLTLAISAVVLQAETGVHARPAVDVPHGDAVNDLNVVAGRSILLDCAQPVERVAVGLAAVAEATAISPTEIMINGKTAGETTLILWERGGERQFFNVTVKASKPADNEAIDIVRHELARQLPGQEFKAVMVNGSVILSGTASDLESARRAVDIVSAAGKVVNAVDVKVPKPMQQILLKVVIASVDRSKSRQLGINLFSNGFGNVLGSISTGQFGGVSVDSTAATISDDLNILAYFKGLNLGATIKALEAQNVVQVLAEPNVMAEDGKQGSFLAGGEYPYPVAQGTGSGSTAISIMFKEFGIRLNFIPKILPDGNIHLQVAPEVSSLDYANGVQVNGFQVPGVDVRRVKTEVELSRGQSFAIGGLLDNRETTTFQKIPFIGDVPILGKFFQSQAKTHNNSELIVIVTPQIVDPAPEDATIPKPNFPEAFMPPNSNVPMHTPDNNGIGSARQPNKPAAIPMQKLEELMKPALPLVETNYGASGSGSGSGSSSGTH
jgi:pilus assembly protein CpaC